MSEYKKKLLDPRWQKKRLEILQRDEWMCRRCCDSESTLHVHHRFYDRSAEPWEYDDRALITLCESCHQVETDLCWTYERALTSMMKLAGALSAEFLDVAHAFTDHEDKLQLNEFEWTVFSHHLRELFASKGTDDGLWDAAVASFNEHLRALADARKL